MSERIYSNSARPATGGGYNRSFTLFICFVAAMGGLLFGYDWVVIGGAKPFYEVFFGIQGDPSRQGWAMSVALLGCLVGAISVGHIAERFGRKKLLIVAAALFLYSAWLTGATSAFATFLLARFIGGIGIGIASNLSPMYIAEVSPAEVRGSLVSINQLTIVLGILCAQVVNWLLAESVPEGFTAADIAASWNGLWGWRYMFWAEAIPAAAFLILVFFIPESPRWLALHGKRARAQQVLARVCGAEQARTEMQLIETAAAKGGEDYGLGALFSKRHAFVLTLGIVVAVFQQWCGTNVIFNYAQEIFQGAGYTINDVMMNIVVTGVANVVFTFVAIYTVDRLGRRALMLIGSAGLGIIYLILGLCFFLEVQGVLMVLLVVLAIGCYAMTLGPITWVLLSEIFPGRLRAVAMSVATFALWTGCFTLTYSFPLLNSGLGSSGTFWIYAAICAAAFIYFLARLPETKGKSLEQLSSDLIK